MDQPTQPMRLGRLMMRLPLLVLAVQAVSAVILATTLSTAYPVDLTGTVKCVSGQTVQGIWIEAFSGGSEFAKLTPATPAGTVRLRHRLPAGGQYQVRVGCGGSPAHWGETVASLHISGNGYDFTCYDKDFGPPNGVCVHE